MTGAEGTEQESNSILQVIGYHQQTKHHLYRYARALGYMDWANQPDPFRRYAGAPVVPLPILAEKDDPHSPTYGDLYRWGSIPSQPVTHKTISRFLQYALSLTAWKEAGGTRWALRANPSSGNLHPTEGYLLLNGLPDLGSTPGLYHYASKEHALERRAELTSDCFGELMQPFPPFAFLMAWTSIHWREAWKYGERGFRYCQHDVGHAVGAARIAAASLGWRMRLLDGTGDDLLAGLLGLNRAEDVGAAEREHPDCVAVVWPGARNAEFPLSLPGHAAELIKGARWHGTANRLSRGVPDPWEIIEVVVAASWKPALKETPGAEIATAHEPDGHPDLRRASSGASHSDVSAGQVILQRRSALAFDGSTALSSPSFFTMLDRVMPRPDRLLLERTIPWDAIPWPPAIHLALFVHRVERLEPGLYMLVRDPAKSGDVRASMHPHFLWTTPPGCPEDLPLYLLETGDARKLAAQVSCHQDIAADGAFSLGMIAEFDATLRRHGAWFYRRLFWETGVIGQVLYLEAEAAGIRATGIGCFFDDPVHQVFGWTTMAYQSLYHFTVGRHVEDPRLTTLPPYDPVRRA